MKLESLNKHELIEKLKQSMSLVTTLREENIRLEEASNSLVNELQNSIILSKNLNDECQVLKNMNHQHTMKYEEMNEIVNDLEKTVHEKNCIINQLESTIHQAHNTHEQHNEYIRQLQEKIKDKEVDQKVLSDEILLLQEVIHTLQSDKEHLIHQLDEKQIDIKLLSEQLHIFQGHIRVICRIKSQLKATNNNTSSHLPLSLVASNRMYDTATRTLLSPLPHSSQVLIEGDEDEFKPKYTYDIDHIEFNIDEPVSNNSTITTTTTTTTTGHTTTTTAHNNTASNNGHQNMTSNTHLSSNGNTAAHIYKFDRVFEPFATHDEVFYELDALIRSAMYGYHSCILSYGGAKTGKTRSIFGTLPDDWGLLQKACYLYLNMSLKDCDIYHTQLSMNMIEIWNEELYDLLSINHKEVAIPDKLKYDKNSIYERNKINKPYLTIHTYKNHVVVEQLTEWTINNMAELDTLITTGLHNRHNIGDRLCKSHIYIAVKIVRTELRTGSKQIGSMKFVDLASSERVVMSTPELTSIDLKETQYVNRGLAALSEVINALSATTPKIINTLIPYRMSKLTALLQDTVREHRQVAVILHISPEEESDENIKNTLDFGIKCKSVQLKRPDKNNPISG